MTSTDQTVDAIVIGAGPNGLVAANLLADAGWEVSAPSRTRRTAHRKANSGVTWGTATLSSRAAMSFVMQSAVFRDLRRRGLDRALLQSPVEGNARCPACHDLLDQGLDQGVRYSAGL